MSGNITKEDICRYAEHLKEQEKSRATIEKYSRDIRRLYDFLPAAHLAEKSNILAFKSYLIRNYKPASVNSMLIAVNGFLDWLGFGECRVKGLKLQRRMFCTAEKELSIVEYTRLLKTASVNDKNRLNLIMQTICATGIRISELPFITVESLENHQAVINCKNKIRVILIPGKICRMLKSYAKSEGITKGAVFISERGVPLNRSYIWREMKGLCTSAGVNPAKVFPHNLRHLFARTYYEKQRDIVKLADILGHSSIETARIYTVATVREHAVQLERLGLIMTE